MLVHELSCSLSALSINEARKPPLNELPINILRLISSYDMQAFKALRLTCKAMHNKLPLASLVEFAFFTRVCQTRPLAITSFYTLIAQCINARSSSCNPANLLSAFFARAEPFAQSLFWRHIILNNQINTFIPLLQQIGPQIRTLYLGKIPFASPTQQTHFEQQALPRIITSCPHLELFEYDGCKTAHIFQLLLTLKKITRVILPESVHKPVLRTPCTSLQNVLLQAQDADLLSKLPSISSVAFQGSNKTLSSRWLSATRVHTLCLNQITAISNLHVHAPTLAHISNLTIRGNLSTESLSILLSKTRLQQLHLHLLLRNIQEILDLAKQQLHLEVLTLEMGWNQIDPKDIVTIAQQFRELSVLRVHGRLKKPPSIRELQALSSLSLKELDFRSLSLDLSGLLKLTHASKLEKLLVKIAENRGIVTPILCPSLRALTVHIDADRQDSEIILESIAHAQSLKKLHIICKQFTDTMLKTLGKLTNLEELELIVSVSKSTPLSYDGLQHLNAFRTLRILRLSECVMLTYPNLQQIAINCPGLEELKIDGSPKDWEVHHSVLYDYVNALKPLKNLHTLCIGGVYNNQMLQNALQAHFGAQVLVEVK